MEQGITLFELIAGGGGLSAGIVSAWVHMRISVGQLKTQIEYLEKQVDEEKSSNKENFDKFNEKLDNIAEVLTQIQIKIGE